MRNLQGRSVQDLHEKVSVRRTFVGILSHAKKIKTSEYIHDTHVHSVALPMTLNRCCLLYETISTLSTPVKTQPTNAHLPESLTGVVNDLW